MGRTLEDIEGRIWEPPRVSSSLVLTCHALRKKALDEFEPEDFRILIGQQMSLDVLVPRAIELLEQEPMAEGNYHPGDLLCAVLRVRRDYWKAHASSQQRLAQVLVQARQRMSEGAFGSVVQKCVDEAEAAFRSGA